VSPVKPWPPTFLVCRCGEAYALGEVHVCRSGEVRASRPELYNRWLDRRLRAEILDELGRLGCDPAFAPGRQQRDFLKD